MPGNTFGKAFRITTFGESHGTAVGVTIDGCPAGLELSESEIQKELDRRRPGQSRITTSRCEQDSVRILSGVFEGKTTGTPIAMIVYNRDVDSSPYIELKNRPRPGHADFTYFMKYCNVDWRGGGRASGRETVGRVAAGAVARKLLFSRLGVEILGHVVEIHGIKAGGVLVDDITDNIKDIKNITDIITDIKKNIEKSSVRCADLAAARKMEDEILRAKREGDSLGGMAEVIAINVPAGLGEPVFDKLDADIAKAIMSVGAVKGVEIGVGFGVAGKTGMENNDPFVIECGEVKTATNNSGGILGGISNGMPVVVRAAVKPTPSIAKEQKTVDLEKMEDVMIEVKGRHDPCILPRVLPVLESMLALVLADHAIRGGFIGQD